VDADVVGVELVDAPLDVLGELDFAGVDDDLDELPQALIAITATSESSAASAARVLLLKTAPPPERLMMRRMYSSGAHRAEPGGRT
jgi:predicted short-subunit dehydrogenase-like oxidoreductase (DUF2520 family)